MNGITGIIGPSGSGKSTFLRLLNKLISPTKGIVRFKDVDIAEKESPELRKEIGMVLQRPFLFKGTVKSNLLYGPTIWKIDYTDEALCKLLDTVGLETDFLERNIDGLSGGEQQRVSLARSLANNPIVLLLDEPTTALDIVSEEIIENTLKRLAAECIKIIIVTHSLEQTKRLTDQLLFLREGQLIEKTTSKDFFKRYNDEEIHSFFKKTEGK
ncbi:MAG: ATP-binding cassette domain-containing protein [Candidatus Heimdallarchaeota archaeon]|nr:ATP-binding cassette domain-containing protein [Candidatus Heimdallarchaeota archaeon]MBY8996016.1 ATP-binding cassette domain-containing protein [Candidatus Heimdallarchaeota archaeon]